MPDGTIPSLAAAHLRLGRAAVGIYSAASALALALVMALLFTEHAHTREQLRHQVQLQAEDRAHALQNHLELLTRELRRLGLRSEVDLFDQNLEPERSLLGISHGHSSFFNLGVAVLGVDGAVVWAEPKRFLPVGQSFVEERWFAGVQRSRAMRIVAIDPKRSEDATLYVIAPIVRGHQFEGAIVGGIDLAASQVVSISDRSFAGASTLLTTAEGDVVFPPVPPPFASTPAWTKLFSHKPHEGGPATFDADGQHQVLGSAAVEGTDLRLVLMIPEEALFRDARARLETRVILSLTLAFMPLIALVVLLRRSLLVFRRGEEQAMREERLTRVGEAANLIAHEVKNSLNGIRMAAELACGPPAPSSRAERALTELRGEIERLSNFTANLMAFSKGIKPRPVRLELNEHVEKLRQLFEVQAEEAGVELRVEQSATPVWVSADPSLLRVAMSNLINNAFDALSARHGEAAPPFIEVRLATQEKRAVLSVTDNGDGVSAEVRPRLFEPFQSGKASGVGIGLALGRRIALAHGGDLALDPTSPGARFQLSLPLENA